MGRPEGSLFGLRKRDQTRKTDCTINWAPLAHRGIEAGDPSALLYAQRQFVALGKRESSMEQFLSNIP